MGYLDHQDREQPHTPEKEANVRLPGSITKALRYSILLGVLGNTAAHSSAEETPSKVVATVAAADSSAQEIPIPPPSAKEIDMNIQQLKALLQQEYAAFSMQPTPEKGSVLVQRIIGVSVLDEAKNSPALLRAIAQEAWSVARQSKSAEAQSLALSFIGNSRLANGTSMLYSKSERSLEGNAHIRLLNADGEYQMALTEIAAMEQEGIETAATIRKLRVATLTGASSHPTMRNNAALRIDLAASRLNCAQLYLNRYIDLPSDKRDDEDLATARKITPLVQPLVQTFINKNPSDIRESELIDDAKGINRELGVTNKAIIAIGKKTPLDTEGHKSLGEYAFIENKWESALYHLRLGQSPFIRKYDPEVDPATGKKVDAIGADGFFQAGLKAWQDAQAMSDSALQNSFKLFAGHMFSEAKKHGLGGISLVTVNDIFTKNPHIEPRSATLDVAGATAVPPVAPTAASTPPAAEVAPTNDNQAKFERKFAEQLLLAGVKITTSGSPSAPGSVGNAKDLPPGDFSITSITASKSQNLAWMAYLGQLRGLTSLKITDCAAGDAEFSSIAQLQNLEVLSISNTNAGSRTLEIISKLPIKVLRLDGVKVNDEMVTNLKAMKLSYLSLAKTLISDRSVPTLSAIETLSSLNVTSTQLSPMGLQQLQKNMPKCVINK